MKKQLSDRLPMLVPMLGGLGFALRRGLFGAAVDSRGLLIPGHPLELCLWLLTAAAVALILLLAWKGGAADPTGPSPAGALGQFAMAAAIGYTVFMSAPMLPGLLGLLWKTLGVLSIPCLLAAAYCRMMGKQPFFLLHTVPSLFLLMHIVNHYRPWSSQPQFQNYIFSLFGMMALVLFSFYCACFGADMPRKRMRLGTGLLAMYFCIVGFASSDMLVMLLGGALWTFLELCSRPMPSQSREAGGTA